MDESSASERGLPKRATIIDVANAAGVSRQTVTRAMNDMSDISPTTRARVRQAAEELGYVPNRSARAMVTGDQPTLGLVLPDLTNPFYPEVAVGVTRHATALGWNVVLLDTVHAGSRAHEALRAMTRQVDAVVGYFPEEPEFLGELWRQLPVVALEHEVRPDMFGLVDIDFAPGVFAALDHLAAQGRTAVALVDLDLPDDRVSGRRVAARAWYEARGLVIDPQREYLGVGDLAGGYDVAMRILDHDPGTQAILAINDVSAFGILKALAELAVPVPSAVSVVGIDGLAIGSMITPELTSLRLDNLAFGEIAVDLVTAMARHQLPLSGPEVRRSISHTFVERASTQ